MGSFEFCVQEITCRDRLCIDLTLLYPGKLTNLGNEAQMPVDSRSTDEASKEKFVHLLPLKKHLPTRLSHAIPVLKRLAGTDKDSLASLQL